MKTTRDDNTRKKDQSLIRRTQYGELNSEEEDAIRTIRRHAIFAPSASHQGEAAKRAWLQLLKDGDQSARSSTTLLLNRRSNVTTGFAEVDIRDGYLAQLFVEPQHMNQGVGSELLANAEEVVRASGGGSLSLTATDGTAPYYRSRGYESVTQHEVRCVGATLYCLELKKRLTNSGHYSP